jgi:hypothetical protein
MLVLLRIDAASHRSETVVEGTLPGTFPLLALDG